tara:strand:+ start:584 stop:859 length:276 start_codon:yes stop_codon:yes gene_type:complete
MVYYKLNLLQLHTHDVNPNISHRVTPEPRGPKEPLKGPLKRASKLSDTRGAGGFSRKPTFSSGELFKKLLGITLEYIEFVKKTSGEILENF